jgi:hypothetical protein
MADYTKDKETGEYETGSYRSYQKDKIKDWGARVQADKKKKYETRAKAKELAKNKNEEAEKGRVKFKSQKKEVRKDDSLSKDEKKEKLKLLNTAKKTFRKSKTTTGQEVRKLNNASAKFKNYLHTLSIDDRSMIRNGGIDSNITNDTNEEINNTMTDNTMLAQRQSFKSAFTQKSPFKACWDGFSADGTKPSPSGKKTASGEIKMVPDCKPDGESDSPATMTNSQYNKKNAKMRKDHKGKLNKQQKSGKGGARVSFSCRFGKNPQKMKAKDGSPSGYAHALKKWGFGSPEAARKFCNNNKKKK